MTDYVHNHLKNHPITQKDWVRPVLHLVDGTACSIQASQHHYCKPKDNSGPYLSVEVWWIDLDGEWETEEPEGWVNVDSLNKEIKARGGIEIEKE
jgi:hypothetical protein